MQLAGTWRRDAGRFAGLVGVIVAGFVAAQAVLALIDPQLGPVTHTLVEAAVLATVSAVVLWVTVLRGLQRQGREQAFAAQLQEALQMGSTEASAYDVVRRALVAAGIRGRGRLLLADSSQAHLKAAVDTAGDTRPPCGVLAPFDCPAIRRGQTSRFRDPAALDACPWLAPSAEAGEGDGAVCVPLTVVGRAIGVLQVSGPDADLPDGEQLRAVEATAMQAGSRIGLLRVMEQTHLQAATDPLTGLLNRRSLEEQAAELLRAGVPFALAMGDLDHFKVLNDTHGHEVGDRALRAFSRTLQESLRGEDLVARYGGEEFVIVLPRQSVSDARRALERVREALAHAVSSGNLPPFTVSFGVTGSGAGASLPELVRAADATLFQAKRQGRDRVVADGDDLTPRVRAVPDVERPTAG